MGFEVNRFPTGGSIDPMVFCPLCHKVLDDPVQLDCVKLEEDKKVSKSKGGRPRHIFCRTCIVEYFANSGIACPIDGEKFKRNTKRSLISPPPRKISDTLSKLEIKCDFHACSKVVQLKNLQSHIDVCEFKAAPILKISLSAGGQYNSIASYHSHVVNNNYNSHTSANDGQYVSNDGQYVSNDGSYPVIPNHSHSGRNGTSESSSYEQYSSSQLATHVNNIGHNSRATISPLPSYSHRQTGGSNEESTLEERLRKLERKYQERLDATKHVLEGKVDQYNQDQMNKMRQACAREIENQAKSHHLQLTQMEEKMRKEVEGLKRHWIEDTQKPLKKQKLRRNAIEPSSSPSSGSRTPRKEERKDGSNMEDFSEEGIFNRLSCKLDEMAKGQKKELLHMITIEMVKTEKVLRQELKDMTDGLRKGMVGSSTKSRTARAMSRLVGESSKVSNVQVGQVDQSDTWKNIQQEVRVLRAEVRKLLRDSPAKKSTGGSTSILTVPEIDPSIILPAPKKSKGQLATRAIQLRKTAAKLKGKKKMKSLPLRRTPREMGKKLKSTPSAPKKNLKIPKNISKTPKNVSKVPKTPITPVASTEGSAVVPQTGGEVIKLDIVKPKKKPYIGKRKKKGRPPGKKGIVPLPVSLLSDPTTATPTTSDQGLVSDPKDGSFVQSDPALILDRIVLPTPGHCPSIQAGVQGKVSRKRKVVEKKKSGHPLPSRRSTRSLIIKGDGKRTRSSIAPKSENENKVLKKGGKEVPKKEKPVKKLVEAKKSDDVPVHEQASDQADGQKAVIMKKKRGRPPKSASLIVPAPVIEDETTLTEAPTEAQTSAETQTSAEASVKSIEMEVDKGAESAKVIEVPKVTKVSEQSASKEATETEVTKGLVPEKPADDVVVLSKESTASKTVVPNDVTKETPKEISKEVPKEAPEVVQKEITKEGSKEAAAKEVSKEKPKEGSKEAAAKEVSKEVSKESSRGDDILRAAMDAIGEGADNYTEAIPPSMMPLPPVATIAGKQFFASFPLSIPFSLPMSIPVFGRLSSSVPKPMVPVQTTMHGMGGTISQSTLVTSTATTSFSPQKSTDLIRPMPKVPPSKPKVTTPTRTVPTASPKIPTVSATSKVVPKPPEPEVIDVPSEGTDGSSSTESTLPFRKRRAATNASKITGSEATNSTTSAEATSNTTGSEATNSATFDEGNSSSEFNIINHILQIEDETGMKPTSDKPVNGTLAKVSPGVSGPTPDEDEDDELENFASITEQVLNDLNSENNSDDGQPEAIVPVIVPVSATSSTIVPIPEPRIAGKGLSTLSSSFSMTQTNPHGVSSMETNPHSVSSMETNPHSVSSMVEVDEAVSSVTGPNATLVSSGPPFQPYLDHVTVRETTSPVEETSTPKIIHDMTQVPPDRFFPTESFPVTSPNAQTSDQSPVTTQTSQSWF